MILLPAHCGLTAVRAPLPAASVSPAVSSAPDFDLSWPEPARDLLRRAIDRHGGWSRWTRLQAIGVGLVSLRGLLPRVKGYGRTFQLPRYAMAYPKQGRTVWSEQPDGDPVAVFDRAAGHRHSFRGLRKLRRWNTTDACFFFGYALASYAAVPFALPQLRYLRAVRGRWRGEALEGVRVEYPAGAEVHSRRQNYLFDRDGLLRRNDYVADVVGAFARGAHGWDDFVTVEGIPVPTRRTVVPRVGTWALERAHRARGDVRARPGANVWRCVRTSPPWR